ncbi:MAG: carbohydrate ABC transporter permease [Clostridia bacterium]|nr:carbohydrate ABC transporter permease [Clostridia bacterium]
MNNNLTNDTLAQRAKRTKRLSHLRKLSFTGASVLVLSVLAVVVITPIILTITNAFMSSSEISSNYGQVFSSLTSKEGSTFISDTVNLKLIPDRVVFDQFSTILIKSPTYILKFWNSLLYCVPIVIFQLVVALAAAYGFARFEGGIRAIIFFTYIILMLMPYQVTLVPNFIVAEMLGILNTRWAIILPGVFSPFAVFILTRFMRRIPPSVIEAAKLDGAGEWKIFRHICVPMSSSIVYSVALLIFIDYWNMVEQPLIMLSDTETHPLSVFLSNLNTQDTGIAFAAATVYMVVPMLLFLYSEDYLVKGISYSGGIK